MLTSPPSIPQLSSKSRMMQRRSLHIALFSGPDFMRYLDHVFPSRRRYGTGGKEIVWKTIFDGILDPLRVRHRRIGPSSSSFCPTGAGAAPRWHNYLTMERVSGVQIE